MPKPLRFKQRLDRYPPILIRLLATQGRRRRGPAAAGAVLTDHDIASASGLPLAEVKRLSYSTSWAGIPVDVAYQFLAGCDIDLEKRRTFRRLEYMRRDGHFRHLRQSPLFETQFTEMIELWSAVDDAQ